MSGSNSEFLALERAIAPFAEGFSVRSGDDGELAGAYLSRVKGDVELGIFAGMMLEEEALDYVPRPYAPAGLVMCYVKPLGSKTRAALVDDEDSIVREAHALLQPIASPEPFELFEDQVGVLVRRRRLPEDVESLMDRRLLEFCRGSLALMGQVNLLDTLREFEL